MAQKAKKDMARTSAAVLSNTHITSMCVHSAFLIYGYLFKSRSMLLYCMLAAPAFFCQYTLEKAGRPTYDPATGTLKTSGEDLAAPGLTEYMFDVIWVTWATVVLVTLGGDIFWLAWLIIPIFSVYKGFSLWGATKQMASMQDLDGPVPPAAGNRKQRRA